MNPYISNDETEIDLLDLGKYLLRRIVWILIAGVLCAACMGAFAYVRGKKSQQAFEEQQSETMSETETDVEVEFDQKQYVIDRSKYEIESELLETTSEGIEDQVERHGEYLANSLYLQIDPYNVWKAQAVVQIESKDRDYPAYQIRELYRQKVYEGQYLKDAAKKRGIDRVYLQEMVGAWASGSSTSVGGTSTDVVIKEDGDERTTSELLTVQGMGGTKDEAVELLEVTMDALQSYSRELKKEYPHKFMVLENYCQNVIDTGIRNAQKDYEAFTKTLMDQVKDTKEKALLLEKPKTKGELYKEALAKRESEKEARDLALAAETEAADEKAPEPPKKHMMKFAIIGFIIGILAMCLVFAIRYMRNDLLVSYKDLERKGFFLKSLGSVSTPQGSVMAAASIRSFAGDGRKLFVTGLARKEVFDRVCAELEQELPGYQLVCAPDVLTNPEARKQLLECDIVALLEQQGVTKYSELKEEVTYLYHTDREIVGIMIS